MKYFTKFLLFAVLISAFGACDKKEDLKVSQAATASLLSASATTIAPLPADSNKTALTLDWTYPNHAVNDPNTVKYVIEMDSVGKKFANPFTQTVTGNLSTSFLAKELNNMLLNKGYAFNVPVSMEARVMSSYANNNERVSSNVLALKLTPYKVPPKVALPASGKLFIVGGATQGEWNNPVPTPSQELARLNETTFAGIFDFKAGQEFLLLPVNGSWDHKYAVANNSVAGIAQGGDFGFDFAQNFKGPAAAGFYKIVVDFQTGKFTVTPYAGILPASLFIVGSATPGAWDNPVRVPAQQFTRINSVQFELTVPLTAAGSYIFLPVNGSWDAKFGGTGDNLKNNVNGDSFKAGGSDLLAPATNGTYKIEVNFATEAFKVTKQ
jgi:hypothetical protein